jgi:hypothetical protein
MVQGMRQVGWSLLAAAMLLCLAGCVDTGTFGFASPGIAYPTEIKRVFQADDPIALLTLSDGGGRAHAQILGKIHGWPFPYEDPSGDFGEGLFSYRTELSMTGATGKLPERANGVRRVYYHPGDTASFQNGRSFAEGEPVISDSVDATFAFSADRNHVDVTMVSHQVATETFTYKGNQVIPPNRQDGSVRLSGDYSSEYGGYLLR